MDKLFNPTYDNLSMLDLKLKGGLRCFELMLSH